MAVRAGRFQDIPAITEIMQWAHAHSVYAETATFDLQEAKSLLRQALQRHGQPNNGGTLVMVSESDGEVRGFMIGVLHEVYPCLRELMATDLLFIMGPGAAWDAPKMIRKLMVWAKKNPKVIEVHLGVTDALADYRRTTRLYQRLGLQECGAMLSRRFER